MSGPQIHLYGCTQPVGSVVPKLLHAALRQDMRAVVRSPDAERIEALNTSLWEGGTAFLPHGADGDDHPEELPVFLTTTTAVPNDAQLLVLLDGADDSDADAFQRVCMLYDATDPEATRSAEAFGRARSDSGGLQWSVQTEEGRWERAPSSAEGAAPAAAATEVPEADESATDDAAASESGDDRPPRREPASVERTLSIIKPDATQANVTGSIVARLEEAGLRVVAQRRLRLTRAAAEGFYAEHQERPFFQSLCDFMTSGPVVVQVLEGEDAIVRNRQVMGATDPGDADPGTLRKDFGSSIEQNAIHGSDSPASAAREIAYFFSALDIVG